MTIKFKASDHLIDLFVGQLVYSSPSACVRELLHNAYDACALQTVVNPDYEQSITFRFSQSGNWFSVEDNGIGMDEETTKESFARVGRPKTELPRIKELLNKGGIRAAQIAIFGIGVLSSFRVAENVTVSTKMEDKPALRFTIVDPKKDFIFHNNELPTERGTIVKVKVKQGIDFTINTARDAVFLFARHVDNLTIVDVDAGSSQRVEKKYDGEDLEDKMVVQTSDVRYGILGLNESWDNPQGNWHNNLRLDNAGFLVQHHDPNLLPPYCFGYTGEIDFIPGRLNLMVNRESFVQDEKYRSISSDLLKQYLTLIENKIRNWLARIEGPQPMPKEERQKLRTYLLVLENRLPTNQSTVTLRKLVEDTIDKYIRFSLYAGLTREITLSKARTQAGPSGAFYLYQPGDKLATYVTEKFDEETTISVTRQMGIAAIKAALLGAQGKIVFPFATFSKPVTNGQALGYDLRTFLSRYCQKHALKLLDVLQVPEPEIQVSNIKLTALINSILKYSKQLKFVALTDSKRRTITDVDSYWVNIANPEVRKILRSIHEVVGNQIKKDILLAYFDLTTHQFSSARKRLESLLANDRFDEISRQRTGVFTAKHVRQAIDNLISIEERKG